MARKVRSREEIEAEKAEKERKLLAKYKSGIKKEREHKAWFSKFPEWLQKFYGKDSSPLKFDIDEVYAMREAKAIDDNEFLHKMNQFRAYQSNHGPSMKVEIDKAYADKKANLINQQSFIEKFEQYRTKEEELIHEKVQWLVEQGALFFSSHSGGKDSQAMYLYLKNIVPPEQLIVIHADLSEVDWKGTWEHIVDNMDDENELVKVKSKHTLFSYAEKERKGQWPSGQNRWCTSELKDKPIFDEAYNITAKRNVKIKGASIWVNCVGIRAEESSNRAGKYPFEIHKKSSYQKDKFILNWFPIFRWSTREVFRFILDSGEKPHWAYSKGMSRLSCCFCIFANRQDLATSAGLNPELLKETAELEKKFGKTIFLHQGKRIGIEELAKIPLEREGKKIVRLEDVEKEYDDEYSDGFDDEEENDDDDYC